MREFDVIVVGAGPAGIFTASGTAKEAPQARVLIVDAGSSIDRRNCPARKTGHCVGCQPCGIMQGWAGAGAFSDGSSPLSEEVGGNLPDYLPRQTVRDLIKYCDDQYLAFGAPDLVHGLNDPKVDEFKYEASKYNIQLVPCPVRHMGTEYSFDVLRAMYRKLCQSYNFTFQEFTTCEIYSPKTAPSPVRSSKEERRDRAGRGEIRRGGSRPRGRLVADRGRSRRGHLHPQQRGGHRRARRGSQFRDGSPDQTPV